VDVDSRFKFVVLTFEKGGPTEAFPAAFMRHDVQELARFPDEAGLRFLWPDPTYAVPGASAFSYRRYRLGVSTMQALFQQITRPLATPETPGAFLFERRLMALDGTSITLPDTAENEASFGRHKTGRGPTAFAQVRCLFLAETGTHAVIDTGFWPIDTSERLGARRLLRSLKPGMLVMWDRGLHSFDMFQAATRQQADVLSPERRLRSNPRVVKRKMSNFKLKRRKHEHWPQPTKPFADVVALI